MMYNLCNKVNNCCFYYKKIYQFLNIFVVTCFLTHFVE